uniref:Major sperm protein n=1 Tax=Panagrolaimus sp. PS1159 TaxID=55785 RepID=A0AC35ETD8_9BILA
MTSEPPPPQTSTTSAAATADHIPAEPSIKSVTGAEKTDPAVAGIASPNPQPSATAVTQQNPATGQQSDKDKEQIGAGATATGHPAQLQQPQPLSVQLQQQQPISGQLPQQQSQPVSGQQQTQPLSVQQQQPVQPTLSPIPSSQSPGSRPAVSPRIAPTLCINPNKAAFTTAGGVSKHLMINKSADRLAIKIRSSNNFFFRVNPVYSFLDCNAVNELEVIRLIGGGAKQDKLQVIYVTCTENDTDPTKLFGLRAKVRSVILPIATIAA